MFAYLIIGVELAILYFVFWFVFIYESKPPKVKGNEWGYYPAETDPFTAYGSRRPQVDTYNGPTIQLTKDIEKQLYKYYLRRARLMAPPALRTGRGQVSPALRHVAQSDKQLRHGWTAKRANRSAIEKLLENLNRAIGQFTIKTPMA